MSKQQIFPSKVLLFGEYSVLLQSNALAIPFHLFEGKLRFTRNERATKDSELQALARYLRKCEERDELSFPLDINSFEFDVGQGLFFDSTIPQGFGVGSSGALVAAIYDRYGPKDESSLTPGDLSKRFALLESHFHGSSSGFDPLVSYLKKPIFRGPKDGPKIMSIKSFDLSGGAIFLLNTGRSRKTEPLVNLFLEKCKTDNFAKSCENVLKPVTNRCIENFLDGNPNELWESFYELSKFQFENLSPMIPKLFLDLWKQGLEEKHFLLKVCGAGGGGFLMGMSRNFKKSQAHLQNFEIRPLIHL